MERAERAVEQCIPINKGNYSMEPPEREALFDNHRGDGWEEEYRRYRTNWTDYPRSRFVSDYPLLVDLELSSLCNLSCPMCYTISPEFRAKVGAGLMDFGLFRRIIDEIGGKTPAVRLSLRGEPTIHPHFIEAIRYAKSHGIKEVSTLTNGSRLDRHFFIQALEAGIDWITISVDGIGDTYETIRKPLRFSETLERIREIRAIKQERKATRPVIKIQAVWPSIRENPEQYYNTFAPEVDLVAFNPLIDYLGNDRDVLYDDQFCCPQPYQRLVIGSDGRALMCSNDEEASMIVGDARRETIHDIWHGTELNRIRALHRRQGGFREISACTRCYLPRRTDDTETAAVNGRHFSIRNYVNRSQRIGS